LLCDKTTFVMIYLGVDGGGSKTSCWIGDETSVWGRGRAEGSNLLRVGEAKARQALMRAIELACADAKISPDKIDCACVGLAGAARTEVSNAVRRAMAGILSAPVEVVGDMVIAMEAAFEEGPGVVVISGTGSIAYGRDSHGQTVRVGGWGPAISDEGSAYWIGKAAVKAALRDFDEGQPTVLLEAVMKSWQVETQAQTVMTANASSPPADFAGLCPGVCLAADMGDSSARRVLVQAGEELAMLANIAMRRLFKGNGEVKIAMAGSVFEHSHIVRESFGDVLNKEHADARVHSAVVEPVSGALALARKIAARKTGKGMAG
jgi:N-acetylglucosamine kinase-like BadF-type ATPase